MVARHPLSCQATQDERDRNRKKIKKVKICTHITLVKSLSKPFDAMNKWVPEKDFTQLRRDPVDDHGKARCYENDQHNDVLEMRDAGGSRQQQSEHQAETQ